jgi:condensin complex subunit 3
MLSNLVDPTLRKSVLRVFSKGIKTNQDPRVQLAATTALCKLMLFDIIKDDDLLKQLVLSYFDLATKDNLVVRQALNYFLPVYSHSRRENMERMGVVAPSVLHALCGLSESLEEDEDMVEQDLVANMLLEWTDARKLVVSDAANASWDEAGKKETQGVNGDIHLLMSEIFLERVLSHGCASEYLTFCIENCCILTSLY